MRIPCARQPVYYYHYYYAWLSLLLLLLLLSLFSWVVVVAIVIISSSSNNSSNNDAWRWTKTYGRISDVQIEGLKSRIQIHSESIVDQHVSKEMYACNNSKHQGLEEHLKHELFKTNRTCPALSIQLQMIEPTAPSYLNGNRHIRLLILRTSLWSDVYRDTGVCEKTLLLCKPFCPAIQEQKVLSSPWFGASKAYLPKSCLLRRSAFFTDTDTLMMCIYIYIYIYVYTQLYVYIYIYTYTRAISIL